MSVAAGITASADATTARRMRGAAPSARPLSIGLDTRSHVILSAQARAGMCSDAPSFDDLLFDAWRRRGGRVKAVLADAGFDSESNHRIARRDMGVRSLIRTGVGRRPLDAAKPPAGHYRRRMKWELDGSQKGKLFAQRAQAETVMSMLKRNLGDALRARSPRARRCEHAFRAVVHDLMLARRKLRASRHSPTVPLRSPYCVLAINGSAMLRD